MNEVSDPTIRRYDWSVVPPSVAVVETLSDATGRDPIDLPTLNDTIDTDGLDALCTGGKPDSEAITVSFVHADYEVTVLGDGTVIVEPINDEQ
ncbi:HalOD1 output domain-containing protein [Halorubrum sp. DTA98]|uniref:HalOD1 output domain-containing protein n=1 Tax=Halorubrum sp. DTA98 TaxID=3402163 RepID=UPI003AAAB970